jgi:phosphoglycolate phosphatase
MQLDGVLFDLDGVLVDSRVAITRSMNHALAEHGFEIRPESELHPLIGPPLHDAFHEVIDAQAGDIGRVDDCVASYRERYRTACVEETLPNEGIHEALTALGRNFALGVATSKPEAFAIPILETLKLSRFFASVVGPSLDARSEPKTRTVTRALRALGIGDNVAIVGDRSHDVVAGRGNGIATIGVTWGIGDEAELREAGADHVVHHPDELVALLR